MLISSFGDLMLDKPDPLDDKTKDEEKKQSSKVVDAITEVELQANLSSRHENILTTEGKDIKS